MFVLMTSEASNPEIPAQAPVRRNRSNAARRAARRKRADREQRIIAFLNRGVSVAEIASTEGVTLKRMRNLVQEILVKRMPQPPAEFLALQVSRLNEALLVSYSAMHTAWEGTNFQAVDRVVRIVRELDRYHGFAAHSGAPQPAAEPLRLAAPNQTPLALERPVPSDSEMAPQEIEIA
jgi:hypothetical protein